MWLEKCTYYYEIAIRVVEPQCDITCSRFINFFRGFTLKTVLSYQHQLVEYWRGEPEYRECLTDAFLDKETIFSGKFDVSAKRDFVCFIFKTSLKIRFTPTIMNGLLIMIIKLEY